jgi:hypothetical protein
MMPKGLRRYPGSPGRQGLARRRKRAPRPRLLASGAGEGLCAAVRRLLPNVCHNGGSGRAVCLKKKASRRTPQFSRIASTISVS